MTNLIVCLRIKQVQMIKQNSEHEIFEQMIKLFLWEGMY